MLTLFFVDDLPTTVGQIYEFDNEDANHAVRVLRMKAGDIFMLSDGQGSWSQVKAFAIKRGHLKLKSWPRDFKKS